MNISNSLYIFHKKKKKVLCETVSAGVSASTKIAHQVRDKILVEIEKTICGMLNGILSDCKKERKYNTCHMYTPCKHAK